MGITIKEITSKNELREFVKFPDKLYFGNKFYIPALHKAELNTLDINQNPAFEFCEAKYWLAYINNEIVGRAAGIINHNYNKKTNKKYVRFGWLDFIENERVLQELMHAVETWAKQNNAEFIHGPLGFSSFDASGVLIEGFNELPTSFAHYNFLYYPKLIEELGYEKDVDWIEFNVKVPESVPENFIRIADLVKNKYKFHSAELKNKKDLLKYSSQIFQLLNDEYKDIYAFSELTKKQIIELKKQFISFLNPKYVSIILSTTNKVVAFGITMPSLSKALQKSKGKLFPFGFIRVLYALRKNDTADTLLIAIQKEYRDKGINALIFSDIMNTFIKKGITNLETTRELENNLKVKQLWSRFEHKQHKRARCYIKKL
ncbi:MAG: N-acetyltransferase [Bacteroidales bacterium]|nr:N-acetyltransferase [Bacteroidales bacterium]